MSMSAIIIVVASGTQLLHVLTICCSYDKWVAMHKKWMDASTPAPVPSNASTAWCPEYFENFGPYSLFSQNCPHTLSLRNPNIHRTNLSASQSWRKKKQSKAWEAERTTKTRNCWCSCSQPLCRTDRGVRLKRSYCMMCNCMMCWHQHRHRGFF